MSLWDHGKALVSSKVSHGPQGGIDKYAIPCIVGDGDKINGTLDAFPRLDSPPPTAPSGRRANIGARACRILPDASGP